MTAVPKPTRPQKVKHPERIKCKDVNWLEEDEQSVVVDWLEAKGIFFQASAMGLYLHPATFMKAKKIGCKKDHPDIVIYDRPYPVENGMMFVGTALEMKRKKNSEARPGQLECLEKFKERGWMIYVAKGADDAIQFLQSMGY